MKWKDSDDAMDSGDEAGSAYEEDYSPLRSRNFALGTKLASLIVQPGVLIFMAALVLVFVIFLMFFPKGESGSPQENLSQQLHELGRKVTSIEEKNKEMEDMIKATQKSTESLLVRLDRLESKFGKQFNDFQKQLKQLKTIQHQQRQINASPKTSTKKSAQKSVQTYTVQKGDTLYSISKQFSVSVPQLRKLNKLSSNEAIFPGQKLTIKP